MNIMGKDISEPIKENISTINYYCSFFGGLAWFWQMVVLALRCSAGTSRLFVRTKTYFKGKRMGILLHIALLVVPESVEVSKFT